MKMVQNEAVLVQNAATPFPVREAGNLRSSWCLLLLIVSRGADERISPLGAPEVPALRLLAMRSFRDLTESS
jgi:hypothetical protein